MTYSCAYYQGTGHVWCTAAREITWSKTFSLDSLLLLCDPSYSIVYNPFRQEVVPFSRHSIFLNGPVSEKTGIVITPSTLKLFTQSPSRRLFSKGNSRINLFKLLLKVLHCPPMSHDKMLFPRDFTVWIT